MPGSAPTVAGPLPYVSEDNVFICRIIYFFVRPIVSMSRTNIRLNSFVNTYFSQLKKNSDVFVYLGRTVHTNPSRKRSMWKSIFKREEFENDGFAFSCGRKTF